jgi:hypothetical protein
MIDDVPGQIDQSEWLGRCVFDSDKAKAATRGVIPPRVFLERIGVRTLSVDRLSFGKKEPLSQLHDSERPGKTFRGWAVLKFSDACLDMRHVRPEKRAHNPCHAEIVLPPLASGEGEQEDQMQHAVGMARVSVWEARPLQV